MLIGQYESTISSKYQTAIPKKFREILGKSLIITKGFEKCLIAVSADHWKTLLEGTEGKPFTNRSSRELQRFLLGNATDVELDSKGRFVIPEYLRKFAGVESEIVFAGLTRFVEIWDKKTWDEHQKDLGERIETIADKLSGENNDN